jgi:hypothetical protein
MDGILTGCYAGSEVPATGLRLSMVMTMRSPWIRLYEPCGGSNSLAGRAYYDVVVLHPLALKSPVVTLGSASSRNTRARAERQRAPALPKEAIALSLNWVD